MTTSRWLGFTFLFVLVVSMAAGLVQAAAAGTGDGAEALAGIHASTTLWRIGLVGDLLTAAGILALAALLYAVLRDAGRPAALVAMALWIAEGTTLAVARFGGFALIPMADTFATAGGGAGPAESAAILAAADAVRGTMEAGYSIHLLFYLLGAVIWFVLFYRSRVLPRPIAIWGILAESVALAASLAHLSGVVLPAASFIHLALLELVVGMWLLVKGAPEVGGGAEGAP